MPEDIGYEGLGLPSEEDIADQLNAAIENWVGRNTMIQDVREMVAGQNSIAAPKSTQYIVRTGHTYMLAAVANEKSARFHSIPEIQVIPASTRREARTKSTKLEKALTVAFTEMERYGDGDVWSRVTMDAILLDEGVEKIEAAPAAFWPELFKETDDPMEAHPYQTKNARDEYKKARGIPVRSLYVPLESFFPVYDGPTMTESFELEYRSLRSVMSNPLFDREALQSFYSAGRDAYKTVVPIIHYCNQDTYAYYACTPELMQGSKAKSKRPITSPYLTKPVLLYSYEHGLGRSIYNCVGGRFGGWKTSNNRIEGTNRGLLELNQQLDNLYSQALTNIGAKYWPNLVQYVDPEQRAYSAGVTPKPITVKAGEPLVMFKGEDLRPTFTPADDPMFIWAYDQIKDQIGRLGGSPVTFGMREPGVSTGFHHAQMITQAEHLDEKLEQHLAQGVINRAVLFFKQVNAIGETVWATKVEKDTSDMSKAEFIPVDPKDLVIIPQMAARVKKTRPIDFVAAIRTALDASSEREGKGPLLDDDTIREELLGQSSPDTIETKLLQQSQKNRILNSGVIDRAIVQKIGLKLAVAGTPEVDSELASAADPALMEASAALQQRAAGMGGTDPALQESMADGGFRQRGMAVTDSQPEARVGEAAVIAGGGSL